MQVGNTYLKLLYNKYLLVSYIPNLYYSFTGNVEILHLGKWGAICDDEWDKKEAEVVCRQLGYSGVESVTHSGIFGPAKSMFYLKFFELIVLGFQL